MRRLWPHTHCLPTELPVREGGVLCLDLVSDDEKQASLFRPADPEREEKERRLMEAVDKLNLWGGRGTVRAASMGAGRPQEWQMRRDRKSPCYTTRIEEVPRAMVGSLASDRRSAWLGSVGYCHCVGIYCVTDVFVWIGNHVKICA